ncbi:PIN-like domain-containing protein [Nocardia niwae]|uniref:PIN-like domain-containing protein n=1 Tax=Nocardia niwae TaxID=626084 RepID=A0ABV2XES5_9NOCA|nr:PIN-like domain-containing protein [Nocardia niwae]
MSATIALDANIMLALYRVSDSQRKQILEVLEIVSDRLWVPYQAALEYQRNRLKVAADQQKTHESISSLANKGFDTAHAEYIKAIGELRANAVRDIRDREIRAAIEQEFGNAIDSLNEAQARSRSIMTSALDELRSKHTIDFRTVRQSDPIRASLDSLITDARVGKKLDARAYDERKKKAEARITARIPPGYADMSKDDATGDCLIWFELLDLAKSTETPVLYITDDTKDAYLKVHGQIIGPHVQLIREMAEESGQKYHQTTLDGFLRLAKKHLKATVSDETIRTVESSRKARSSKPREYGNILRFVTANAPEGAEIPGFLVELTDEEFNSRGKRVFVTIPSTSWLETSGVLVHDSVVLENNGNGYDIIGPVVDRRTGSERLPIFPETCGDCGSELTLISQNGREWLKCPSEACRQRLNGRLRSVTGP